VEDGAKSQTVIGAKVRRQVSPGASCWVEHGRIGAKVRRQVLPRASCWVEHGRIGAKVRRQVLPRASCWVEHGRIGVWKGASCEKVCGSWYERIEKVGVK
jgi:hypothetical protein